MAMRPFADRCAEWDAELAAVLADLDVHLKSVAAANEPTVMPDDVSAGIRDLAGRAFPDHLGEGLTLITPEEARVLSIPRGSLTPGRVPARSSRTSSTPTSSSSRSRGRRSSGAFRRLPARTTKSSTAPATPRAGARRRFPSRRG